MNYLIIVVAYCLFVSSNAQIFGLGPCPKVQAKRDFDLYKFSGKWYEYEKTFMLAELTGKCTTFTYTNDSDTTMTVVFKQIEKINNLVTSVDGIVSYIKDVNVAEMDVVYPSHDYGTPSAHWILETDYTNFAIIYSCSNLFEIFNLLNIWILTRAPRDQDVSKAYNILRENGVQKLSMVRTDQFFCPKDY